MTKDKTFDELWRDLEERSRRWAIPIVQDYKELEYIFNLIKGCESYLEVGTAEGNSLYILSHALRPEANITIVDFGEKHTGPARKEVTDKLEHRPIGLGVDGLLNNLLREVYGNSHCVDVFKKVPNEYDVVFIDAGHTYEDVIADAIAYGHLATKYIIFHDIQLPAVRKAFNWYLAHNPQFKHHEFINSTTYGYGIIEV